MYQPPLFAETRRDVLFELVRANPFGMLVSQQGSGLEADHLPFLLDAERGPHGTLLAHVARANPLWQALSEGAEVLVVFRGAQGYISPNWYLSKAETHRHVPTWNYEVVHAHGRIRFRQDDKFLRAVVGRLTRQHEADQPRPWRMSDAPADYLAEELAQIVGLEVELTRIEGKRKLSQNRDARDFASTVAALEARGEHGLARAMRKIAKGQE